MTSVLGAQVLLLDLDGVVFRHPTAFARLHARVGEFVASRVPDSCAAREVHNALFRSHGHTLLGMREQLGDTSSIETFNRFVFDAAMIDEVRRIPRPNDTMRHSAAVRQLVAHARSHGTDTYIFSNAPRNWVAMALSATGLSFEPDHVIVGEELGFLKPQREAYAAVEARFGAAGRLIFVDDSQLNVLSAPNNGRWFSILYDANASVPEYCPHASCCTTVKNLNDVARYV